MFSKDATLRQEEEERLDLSEESQVKLNEYRELLSAHIRAWTVIDLFQMERFYYRIGSLDSTSPVKPL